MELFLSRSEVRAGPGARLPDADRPGQLLGVSTWRDPGHPLSVPPGQAKYVSCVSGAIIDVVVDIRVGSPTWAGWEAVRLDDQERQAVFMAEGLGHAFVALTDDAVVMSCVRPPMRRAASTRVHPLDPALGIASAERGRTHPVGEGADRAYQEQARRDGLLPHHKNRQVTRIACVAPLSVPRLQNGTRS